MVAQIINTHASQHTPTHAQEMCWSPQARRRALIDFLDVLSYEPCLLRFEQPLGNSEHHSQRLEIELSPGGQVRGLWRQGPSLEGLNCGVWRSVLSAHGIHFYVDFPERMSAVLWIEASLHAPGQLSATISVSESFKAHQPLY